MASVTASAASGTVNRRPAQILDEYGRGRGQGNLLRSQLSRRFSGLPEEEIEEAVQTACRRFLDRAPDVSDPAAVHAYLHRSAYNLLVDELARRARTVVIDPTADVVEETASADPGPAEELIALEDEAELRMLVEEVAASLTDRQRDVFSLWASGRRRSEIASELGIKERTVKWALEETMQRSRAALAERAGGGCEEGESLVLRFVCGIAEAGEALRARAHLERCGRCGSLADQLEAWRDKAGAVLGPVAVEAAHPGLVARVIGRAGEAVSSARRHALGGATQVKEQAVAAGYTRTPDPTPLAGIRPGAVAAVVVGCLAIGGGATYCAQQGVDPLNAATGLIAGSGEEAKEEPPPAKEPEAASEPVETPAEAPVAPDYETVEEAPVAETAPTERGEPHQSSAASEVGSRHEAEPAHEEATAPVEAQFEPETPDYPVTESSSTESSSSESSSSSSGSGAATTETSKPAPVPANSAPQFGGP
ncbi:MAG: sigma-70 family RNA polymerase sigma factor [Actinobacteria bacterium]|nr:sigma-70 family RNA polymerase sigma factor [Actinomycetota bacterium]